MPDIAAVLKHEIRRLARKEIRTATATLQKIARGLKGEVTALRQRVRLLEQGNAAPEAARATEAPAPGHRMRVSGAMIRRIREGLKLTREQFGALLGVSSQSIYKWEQQEGRLTLRTRTAAAVAEARGLGVREARKRLAALAERPAAEARQGPRRKRERATRP